MKRATGAALLLAGGISVSTPAAPDAAVERRAAQEAERRQDLAAALTHYETVYDATSTDEGARAALRQKMAALRKAVPPNADPAKAGLWRVRAFAFRNLDFKWTNKEGQELQAQWAMRDDEVAFIRAALGAFAARVWEYSSGNLRIDWALTVVEQPLTKLDGQERYWPGPGACMPLLAGLATNEADTIICYAKVRGGKNEAGEEVPMMLLGGALGASQATKGATYIGFNTGGGMVAHEPAGEAELHEWLHSAQWTLEDYQGYPRGLMGSPDGGRREGEAGGDPCYRRGKEEPGWVGYYQHLMQAHVTRKMWRELSLRAPPDNAWASQYARRALALGPFAAGKLASLGIDAPFIDEARASPQAGAREGGCAWQAIASTGRTLDLIAALGDAPYSVGYLAVAAVSQAEQPALLRVGSDDGCRVWHNGAVVLSSPGPRALRPDEDAARVTLKKGRNLFLVKVTNAAGGWCATLRLSAADGGPLPGVAYAEPEGAAGLSGQ